MDAGTGASMDDLTGLDDHDLLAGGVADRVAETRAQARRWARLVEFHRRREAEARAGGAVGRRAILTPRAETVTEVCALWGLTEKQARHDLNVAIFLERYFPEAWAWCLEGRLDCFRATMVADHVRHAVSDPVLIKVLASRLTDYLRKALDDSHGVEGLSSLVGCTHKQLRNKLSYEINRLRPADAGERHRKAYADRSVRTTELEDGMGHLGISATVDQVRLADHRLTHAARQLRRGGDERTVAQLKSDLALDLLTGRGEGVPTPTYARPIINLTVPIQTVMGLSDDPGVLSGGTPIPAGLSRAIAADPDATWYRMLTDPAGQMVELSTRSYQPTAAIWRHVTAHWVTCAEPACEAPATQVELDHRERWPEGETRERNLWPLCKRGHTAKHTPGFRIEQTPDGSFALHTRAGFSHHIKPPAQPSSDIWPDLRDQPIQLCATELIDALEELRNRRDQEIAQDHELAWEHEDLDAALAGLTAGVLGSLTGSPTG